MRLILAITKLDAGGMERFCATLCNTLVTQERACTVCALHPAAPGAARDWLSPDVSYVELNRPARFAAPALMRLCRKHPRDPVLAMGVEICAVLVMLKRLGLIRNPIIYRESTAVLVHCSRFWRWIIRRFVSRADGLIVQSRQALADLGQLFAVRQPTALIRNPCAFLQAKQPPEPPQNTGSQRSPLPTPGNQSGMRRADIRDAGILPESQTVSPIRFRLPGSRENLRLLSVGRLEGMKGHERLIRALPGLRRRFPGTRLMIAGHGSLAGQLQSVVQELELQNNVELAGYVQHPEGLYGAADVFVLPSFYEGLPNVVIEALTMGCPVIAAAGGGGTRELMEELGLGVFVVPDDRFEKGLSDAVERVVTSDRGVWECAQKRLAEIAAPEVVADQVWAFAGKLKIED